MFRQVGIGYMKFRKKVNLYKFPYISGNVVQIGGSILQDIWNLSAMQGLNIGFV